VKLPNPKTCSKCGLRGTVVDSRAVASLGTQRRSHACTCGHRWNTYETVLDPRRIRMKVASPERLTVTKPR